MKKTILLILLSVSLFSFDIPFDANFRVKSQGDSIIYSTRLNLIKFNTSKIIYIFEQRYDPLNNRAIENHSMSYIYYW